MKKTYLQQIKRLLFFSFVFVLFSLNANAQTSESIEKPEKEFKNTIHFNITNPLIFGGKSLIFGYERVLKNNQTFSINIGQAGLPSFNFVNDAEFKSNTILSEGGFHLSGDYRFYLSKLNKYNAPRGVYIGPYISHNTFDKKHSWQYQPDDAASLTTVESDMNIKINQIGFQLGYQFVFWKRFSVDMILIGPGIATYKIKADIGGNLSDEDRQKFLDKLNEALKDKFPGYDGLDLDGEFQKKGTVSTTSFGYRYMIQIGYRF
ncbi:hypothetical protein C3L50_11590 [Flavobacterium alvei]|uniref:DUF3575 domain-containing protein n=1 Tax=Flavobacterium alvei TaxID=2080416 RepID=A0A2S5A842_9FLAO|nr:hypothetical protein [Flavobacterium alvei]POY38771.1 hypothetical protein C3L50_11590 [Flavobacterium alvei]